MKIKKFLSLILAVLMICGLFMDLRILARRDEETVAETPQWVKDLIEPIKDSELKEPGSVKVFKPIIEEDSEVLNKWKVKMLVAARDIVKTSRIVLLVDESTSMKGDRITKAKESGVEFVKNILDESDNTKIAIATFGKKGVEYKVDLTRESGNAQTEIFLNDKKILEDIINNKINIKENVGTFTQAGLRVATEMLDKENADHKYIVCLSDGIPTYSYGINRENIINNTYECFDKQAISRKDVPINYFSKDTVGNGKTYSNIYSFLDEGETYKYLYNHGNSAISEAKYIKDNKKIYIYTVGLQTSPTGSQILKEIASTKNYFTEVTDVNQLKPVFKKIGASILSAIKNPEVEIEFNNGFELMPGAEKTAKHSSGSEIKFENGKPVWDMGNAISTKYSKEEPHIKYEYIEYEITINNDILKNKQKEYNPLKNAKFSYENSSNINKETEFPTIKCNPKFYILQKNIIHNDGGEAVDSDKREFQFKVEKKNGINDYTKTEVISLRQGEKKLITRPYKDKIYRIYELKTGKAYDEAGKNFIAFNVDNYYNNFSVDVNGNSSMKANAPADGLGKYVEFGIAKNVDNCTTTFINNEIDDAKAIVTLKKVLEKVEPRAAIYSGDLEKVKAKKFKITLKNKEAKNPGRSGDNVEFNIEAGQSITMANMCFCTYVIHEDEEASPYVPKENEQDKEVKVTLYNVLKGKKKGQIIKFTNVYDPKETTTFEGTKIWKGGPKEDRNNAKFKLYRQIRGSLEKEEVTNKELSFSSADANSNTVKCVWKNLEKYCEKFNKNSGKEYIYSFEESGVENGKITINGHTYTVTQNGDTITNTYVIPKTKENVIGKKIWVDNKTDHPAVEFELWRKNGTAGDGEKVVAKKALTNNEVDFGKQDLTDINGVEYEYFVKEVTELKDYVKTENGLTVTNTMRLVNLTVPNKTVTAKKVWVNGAEKDHTKVDLTLYRQIQGGKKEKVNSTPTIMSVEGTSTEFEYKWKDLPQEDSNKKLYIYTVDEEQVPENYEKKVSVDEQTKIITVTNTYVIPKTKENVVGKKIWVDNKKDHPEVEFELWRKNGTAGDGEKVVDKKALTNNEVDFGKQDLTDINGVEYEYFVKETTELKDYVKTENGLTVTNTMRWGTIMPIGAKDVTITKVWENGPKPNTTLVLKRQVEGKEAETVGEFTATKAETTKTFKTQPLTDKDGKEYNYFVEEPNVPANYTSKIDGLTVTNTYNIPKITFTATKEWIGDEKVTRPEVKFILYRAFNGEWEKVKGAEEKTIGDDLKAEWTNLPKTDDYGNEYSYFVKEEYINNDIKNYNFRTEYENNIIRNIVKTGKTQNNEDKTHTIINDKLGKIVINKIVDEEDIFNADDEFYFSIVGPYGYTNEVKVKANSKIEIPNLYYGHYNVVESNSKGLKSSIGSGVEFDLKEGNEEKIINVINSKDFKNQLVNKKIVKIWKGGSKSSVIIELWRKSSHVNEKIGEFLATASNSEKEFKNLKVYDEWNEKYEYYAKEPNVPANYTSTIKGLTVTNTFISPKSNHIIAKKLWIDGDLAEFGIPEIGFELWRKTSFGKPELVVPKTFVPHDDYSDVDTIDFGVQDELDASGERYEYFVREVFSDARDEYDWEKHEDGLVVENRYVGPIPNGEIEKKIKVDDRKTDIHKAYLKGYPDNSLRPDGEITRAEAAAIISRLEGYDLTNFSTPNFPDTNVNWYKPYINAVVSHKVMKGYPDGTFKPNQSITRAEFAMMLMPIDKMNNAVAPFNDVRGHWAEKAINQAFGNKRIDGYPDGKFRPNAFITRAEAVAMINRKYNRVVDKKGLMDRYYKYIAHFKDLKVNEWYYYDMIEATNTHEFKRRGTKDKYFREHEDWIKVLKSNIN